METQIYKPEQFNLSGLNGISDKTLEMHFKLYEGYVKGTNELTERIAAILSDGKVDKEEMPAYSELTRRLGFEYNGMVLHEYYFGNMKKGGGGDAARGSNFRSAVEKTFPSYEIWRTDFVSVGKMRGVGWAICYLDPTSGTGLESLDRAARDRQRRRLRPAARDGRLGARVPARLQARRPAEIHRRVLSNIDWSAVEHRYQAVHITAAAR